MRGEARATPISLGPSQGLAQRGRPGRTRLGGLAPTSSAVAAGRASEAWTIGQKTTGNPTRAVGSDRGHNGKEQRCRQDPANDNHFHFLFLSALLCVALASRCGETSSLFTVLREIWRQRTAKKGRSQGRDEV
jgi:hypothetical protein